MIWPDRNGSEKKKKLKWNFWPMRKWNWNHWMPSNQLIIMCLCLCLCLFIPLQMLILRHLTLWNGVNIRCCNIPRFQIASILEVFSDFFRSFVRSLALTCYHFFVPLLMGVLYFEPGNKTFVFCESLICSNKNEVPCQ